MRQETLAPERVLRVYLTVLEDALTRTRMRIRYGETIDQDELHDLTDALHNIPEMLCAYGKWHVEKTIDEDLKRYDDKWPEDDSSRRQSLLASLKAAQEDLDGTDSKARDTD